MAPYLEFSPKTCRNPKICYTGIERGCKPVLYSVLFILSAYDKALKIYKSDQSKKKTQGTGLKTIKLKILKIASWNECLGINGRHH